MVPGFRYHVVTVAAIFLALGVGIIIGSSFVQSAIVDRQTGRLEELKAQFSREVVPLRDRNQHYADFLSSLAPSLLSGRLTAKRIAIVQTGDYPDAVRKVRETLEQAGATIASVTTVSPLFPDRVRIKLDSVISRLQPNHRALTPDVNSVLRVLAAALANGAPASDLTALTDAELVDTDGDYGHRNDYIVLVGGATAENDGRAESVDVPLINQLRSLGATVVAAEPETAAISYIAPLRGAVPTIDNADTDIGRLALIMALDAAPGDYGVKKTARSGILPPSPPVR